jgi:hypothetical protein
MANPDVQGIPKSKWKKVAIISFFLGIGLAFGAALVVGSALWYAARSKQWNLRALHAQYRQSDSYVTLEDWYQKELNKRQAGESPKRLATPQGEWISLLGKTTVQVSYDLENTTASDYTLQPPQSAGLTAMQELKPNGTLVEGKNLKWSLAEPLNHLWTADQKPILIPAHQIVRVVFSMEYEINDDDSSATSITDWNDKTVRRDFARHLLKDAEAFVLLDESSHYRIELPLQDALR